MVSIPSYNTHIATYDPIARTTTTSLTDQVTFTNIPTTGYTDLILVCAFEFDTAAQFRFQVGDGGTLDTGANYSFTGLVGNGSTASSFRRSSQNQYYAYNGNGITANTRTTVMAQFMSYANTNVYKTTLISNANASDEGAAREVMLWRDTAAIDIIKVHSASGEDFEIGTKFSLYGIRGEL